MPVVQPPLHHLRAPRGGAAVGGQARRATRAVRPRQGRVGREGRHQEPARDRGAARGDRATGGRGVAGRGCRGVEPADRGGGARAPTRRRRGRLPPLRLASTRDSRTRATSSARWACSPRRPSPSAGPDVGGGPARRRPRARARPSTPIPTTPTSRAGAPWPLWAGAGCEVHVLICTDGDKGTTDPDVDPRRPGRAPCGRGGRGGAPARRGRTALPRLPRRRARRRRRLARRPWCAGCASSAR